MANSFYPLNPSKVSAEIDRADQLFQKKLNKGEWINDTAILSKISDTSITFLMKVVERRVSIRGRLFDLSSDLDIEQRSLGRLVNLSDYLNRYNKLNDRQWETLCNIRDRLMRDIKWETRKRELLQADSVEIDTYFRRSVDINAFHRIDLSILPLIGDRAAYYLAKHIDILRVAIERIPETAYCSPAQTSMDKGELDALNILVRELMPELGQENTNMILRFIGDMSRKISLIKKSKQAAEASSDFARCLAHNQFEIKDDTIRNLSKEDVKEHLKNFLRGCSDHQEECMQSHRNLQAYDPRLVLRSTSDTLDRSATSIITTGITTAVGSILTGRQKEDFVDLVHRVQAMGKISRDDYADIENILNDMVDKSHHHALRCVDQRCLFSGPNVNDIEGGSYEHSQDAFADRPEELQGARGNLFEASSNYSSRGN